MDGDSGDEGNDELTCVRSDNSDKSSFTEGFFNNVRSSSNRRSPEKKLPRSSRKCYHRYILKKNVPIKNWKSSGSRLRI